jgi:[ribosomal protein S18]-alanine N-acetyltransferase
MRAAIRPALPADIPALVRIHGASFAEPWDEPALAALMERAGAITLVAGEPVLASFLLAQVAADECEILTLATAPAARRVGLARALIRAAAALAQTRGARMLYLEAAADNDAAAALYRGLGFETRGRRRAYYSRQDKDAADAVLFGRSLPL